MKKERGKMKNFILYLLAQAKVEGRKGLRTAEIYQECKREFGIKERRGILRHLQDMEAKPLVVQGVRTYKDWRKCIERDEITGEWKLIDFLFSDHLLNNLELVDLILSKLNVKKLKREEKERWENMLSNVFLLHDEYIEKLAKKFPEKIIYRRYSFNNYIPKLDDRILKVLKINKRNVKKQQLEKEKWFEVVHFELKS